MEKQLTSAPSSRENQRKCDSERNPAFFVWPVSALLDNVRDCGLCTGRRKTGEIAVEREQGQGNRETVAVFQDVGLVILLERTVVIACFRASIFACDARRCCMPAARAGSAEDTDSREKGKQFWLYESTLSLCCSPFLLFLLALSLPSSSPSPLFCSFPSFSFAPAFIFSVCLCLKSRYT